MTKTLFIPGTSSGFGRTLTKNLLARGGGNLRADKRHQQSTRFVPLLPTQKSPGAMPGLELLKFK